jgi:DNA-binding LacI/PurR family transcriptional regulator
MSDIAERAGVARPTVSLVLNNRGDDLGIKQETREKILRAAEELGYRRNELARQVKTGKSYTLGFLAGAAHLEYGARSFSGALDEADARGYTMKRFKFDDTIADRQVIARSVEHRLAGVIINDPGVGFLFDEMRAEFERHKLPFVLLDNKVALPFGAQVRSDDEGGAYEITKHLIGLEHKRIAFLGGLEGAGSSVPRFAGYERAMKEAGLDKEIRICWSEWKSEIYLAAIKEFLNAAEPATALFCASDPMALGAVLAIRRMGYRVPEDISITGFGDLARMSLVDPPMTTVAVDYEGMGRAAVDVLLNGPGEVSMPTERLLPTRLVVRESTAPARA